MSAQPVLDLVVIIHTAHCAVLVPPTLSIKNREIKCEGSPCIRWDMIVAEGWSPKRQKSVPGPGALQLWPEPLKRPKSPKPYLRKAVYSRLLNIVFQARKSKDNYADKSLKIVSKCFLFLMVTFPSFWVDIPFLQYCSPTTSEPLPTATDWWAITPPFATLFTWPCDTKYWSYSCLTVGPLPLLSGLLLRI